MKIRFKLRTLLIATALICVFLGLQVHVDHRVKRFVDEENAKYSNHTPSEVVSATVADIFLLRRRYKIRLLVGNGVAPSSFHVVSVGVFSRPKAIDFQLGED